MTQAEVRLEGDSIAELLTRGYEYAYEQGWTDGLPIIPATAEMVKKFVAASGRKADDLIASLPPRKGQATVEAIAVNAVMAGCKPEYMPVVIAAIEGISDPTYPLELMQVTTNPMTPFFLVNDTGPEGSSNARSTSKRPPPESVSSPPARTVVTPLTVCRVIRVSN